ncbi:MAG: hypothetical protein WAU68_16525 [Vitreimonas sp.]
MSENSQLPESKPKSINILEHRANLAGVIQDLEARLQRDHASLNKIDDALRVIDPEIDIGGLKVRRGIKKRHEVGATDLILSVLREAPQPLTARELGFKLAEARGQTQTKEVEKAIQQTGTTLQSLRRQGTVEAIKVNIGSQKWRVSD